VKKTARDYGLERCCNHDLRRWDAYGDGGAGNSEAWRRVLKGQAREEKKKRKRFLGEKELHQEAKFLEKEQEWKSKANCARHLERCVGRGVDRLLLRNLDWLQTFYSQPSSWNWHQEAKL